MSKPIHFRDVDSRSCDTCSHSRPLLDNLRGTNHKCKLHGIKFDDVIQMMGKVASVLSWHLSL